MYFFYMYKIHVDRSEDAQAVLEILNAMIQCIKLINPYMVLSVWNLNAAI